MEAAMEVAGESWNDVFNRPASGGSTRDRQRNVFLLGADHLSPESVRSYCLLRMKVGKTEAAEAISILAKNGAVDVPELIASEDIPKTSLDKAVSLVHPRHYSRMLTIAIKKRRAKCIKALADVSFLPEKKHVKAAAKLKGKGAKPVKTAVEQMTTGFVIE